MRPFAFMKAGYFLNTIYYQRNIDIREKMIAFYDKSGTYFAITMNRDKIEP